MGWFGNIFEAREKNDPNEELTEEYDGNYKYKNGTYGQSDYTVRPRGNGLSDVYTTSNSDKNHTHDVIDDDGNIVDRYHDYKIVNTIDELLLLKMFKATLNKKSDNDIIQYTYKKNK